MSKEKKKRMKKEDLLYSLRILSYLRPYRFLFFVGIVFLFVSSSVTLAFPWFIGKIVDAAQEVGQNSIRYYTFGLVGFLIAQALFSYFRVYVFAWVSEHFLKDLKNNVFDHILSLPLSFFDKNRVGEISSRLSADIALLKDTFTTTLAEFSRQIIVIIGSLVILLSTLPTLTFFMLSTLPPVVIVAIIVGRRVRGLSQLRQKKVADSNTIVEETLVGIINVKSFTNEPYETDRYNKTQNEIISASLRSARIQGLLIAIIILGLFGAIVAVVWKGALMIQSGELLSGELTSFMLYSVFLGGSIAGIASFYTKLQSAVGAVQSIFSILDEKRESSSLNSSEIKSALESEDEIDIEFKNISFSYPTRDNVKVFENVSFSIPFGQKIAIVGKSGIGKSTLTQLLLGFYTPQEGEIFLNGHPTSSVHLRDLRKLIGFVPQDTILFGDTIRKNIAYGNTNATEEEIIEVARQAHAIEFIEGLPKGLDTTVGERGTQLSGGQKQRIAIARALLKKPRILVMDEGTSALDNTSEKVITDFISTIKGMTIITIAHRDTTIQKSETVLEIISNNEIQIQKKT